MPKEKRQAIELDLKAGKGLAETGVKHGAANSTVQRIRHEIADQVPEWKRRTAAVVMEATGKLVARINREVDTKSASLKDLSISAGILLDKQAQLCGEPSQIVTHKLELGDNLGQWLAIQEQKKALPSTKAAEVVELDRKDDDDSGV